uniref:CDP-diacylglycerol--serine O-phosphatidyltransferase n=1 Tax=Tetraselmis sp. GSL018 TaxID=582737 RepID=A0A061R748_9CHLO|mmetsp:Transcript_25323/g.60233  ORF Transcript_25323/g.60233 Transcript_25323/m.60233 type:complete len:231 (-) Transcript_25323:354-1046(-)
MLLTVSVGFELMELTFQHWLPNFNECWWDSWILDVAICNNIGIVVGMALVAHFKGKTYHWSGVSSQKSVVAKVTRGLGQFLPYSFDSIEWEWMSGPTRLVQCLIPCAMNLQFKVVAFFLKYILWIPPTNPLNTIRLIIWFLMCLPATLEYYEYINNPSTVIKIGYFAWLTMFVTVVEILICIKFGRGMFTAPWPPRVLWFWGAMSAGFAAFLCTWYLVSFLKKRRKSHAE